MTLEDLYAKLGAIEGGAEMVNTLKAEFKARNDEAAKHRVGKKQILEALGIGEDDDAAASIEELKALKKSGVKPDAVTELNKKIDTLTKKYEAEQKARTGERLKRLDSEKYNKAITALKAGNALNETELAKIIVLSIKANDDDTFTFLSGDKETSIEDGVKSWLDANKWAVRNTQTPGSGSSAGGGAGVKNPWSKESFNLTEQGKILSTDPALAAKLKAEANAK